MQYFRPLGHYIRSHLAVALVVVAMVLSTITGLLRRTTTVGVTRIMVGVITLWVAPLFYVIADWWFHILVGHRQLATTAAQFRRDALGSWTRNGRDPRHRSRCQRSCRPPTCLTRERGVSPVAGVAGTPSSWLFDLQTFRRSFVKRLNALAPWRKPMVGCTPAKGSYGSPLPPQVREKLVEILHDGTYDGTYDRAVAAVIAEDPELA